MQDSSVEDKIRKMLAARVACELGIVPMTGHDMEMDVNRVLKGLDPKEATRMKRKFRKLWRKHCINSARKAQIVNDEKDVHYGGRRRARLIKKSIVMGHIEVNYVRPAMTNISLTNK